MKRFIAHKKGLGAKYTKKNKPEKIVFVLILEDKSSALQEEYRIKKLTREKKVDLIEKNKVNTLKILKEQYYTTNSKKSQ